MCSTIIAAIDFQSCAPTCACMCIYGRHYWRKTSSGSVCACGSYGSRFSCVISCTLYQNGVQQTNITISPQIALLTDTTARLGRGCIHNISIIVYLQDIIQYVRCNILRPKKFTSCCHNKGSKISQRLLSY